MINLDINQNNRNRRQNNENDPLATTSGSNVTRTLDEELALIGTSQEDEENDSATPTLDYYLAQPDTFHMENIPSQNIPPIPPQTGEPDNQGYLSGFLRNVANFAGAGVDYLGQVFISLAALGGNEIAGLANAIPEVTLFGEPEDNTKKPLRDTPHGWLPEEAQQEIANKYWRAGIVEAPAWAGSQWKGAMNNLSQFINGTERTYIDDVTHSAGTGVGFAGAAGTIKNAIGKMIDILPSSSKIALLLKTVGHLIEAGTEAGGFIVDKYMEDPTVLRSPEKLINMAKLAGMNFTANAIPDVALDFDGGVVDKLFPVKGLPLNIIKEFGGQITQELIQENYQNATERATERTFKSKDISLGNFLSNLTDEYRKILPYTDENGQQHSGTFIELAPTVSAATGLSTLFMLGTGFPNPAARGHLLTKKGRQTLLQNMEGNSQVDEQIREINNENYDNLRQDRDALQVQRDTLQEQINSAYQSYGTDIDTDMDAIQDVQAMQNTLQDINELLQEYDNTIANFWNEADVVTNPVQDDAGISLFPDIDEINQTSSNAQDITQEAAPPETQDAAYLPSIVDADELQETQNMQDNNIPSEPELITENSNSGAAMPNNPLENSINSLGMVTENEPDIAPDANVQQVTLPEDFEDVDDEPDAELEGNNSELYNQSANGGYSQDNISNSIETDENNGDKNVGTFIFSTKSKDYSFNVVSTSTKLQDNTLSGNNISGARMSRWFGRFLEVRNKLGKVIASYTPHLDGNFWFDYSFTRNHSGRWLAKFEHDFKENLQAYLNNGNFLDEQGNLKPDGNEDFRKRWSASNSDIYDNVPHVEDFDAPEVGKLTVSYQNDEGLEVNKELPVVFGEFDDSTPAQKQYYRDYLDVKDEYGNLIARYAPRTGTVKFSSHKDAKSMKQSVMQQLRRKAKSLMRNAGYLDSNGNLLTDGNEGYRTRRQAANDIPSSMPNIQQNAQSLQASQQDNTAPQTQQVQTQQVSQPQVSPLGQQNNTVQPQKQANGRKANLDNAISNVGNRVDSVLGNNGSQAEIYNQAEQGTEGQQSAIGRAVDFVTGLLGRNSSKTNNNKTNTAADTSTGVKTAQTKNTTVKTFSVAGNDGKQHKLTVKRKEFSDKHKEAKQYHGNYLEATDETGRVIARWSPYSNILQMANIPDAETFRPLIENSLKNSKTRTNYLKDFGFTDEHGKLLSDGNEKFRHEYRTRLDTNPKGTVIHPNNRKTSTGKRTDNRNLFERTKDRISERRAFKRVRADIYKQLMKAFRKVANTNTARTRRTAKQFTEMLGKEYKGAPVTPTRREQQRLSAGWRIVARNTAHLATSVINGFAHSYGMPIEQFYKDGMHFNVIFNSNSYETLKDKDGHEIYVPRRGFMNFIPAGSYQNGVYHPTSEMVLNITRLADPSTSLHEFAHAFLKELGNMVANINDLPQEMYQNWTDLTKWLGISDIDFTKPKHSWSKEQQERYDNAQEKFASGIEKYFATGKAPSSWLKDIFEKFKIWLSHVYHSLKDIRYTGKDGQSHEIEITSEVRKFYDNLFKNVPYVPSAEGTRTRLAMAHNAVQDEGNEGYFNQAANEQDNSSKENNEHKTPENEKYNQIIGVQGAEAIDKANGNTWLMDNLKVARQMERSGMPVKKMWLATGWMRGADGKWRYEIMDGKLIKERMPNQKTYAEFQALLDKAGNSKMIEKEFEKLLHMVNDGTITFDEFRERINQFKQDNNINDDNEDNVDLSRLTDKEAKRFKRLEKIYKDKTLKDVYDAPELFNAYPELSTLQILFEVSPSYAVDDDTVAFYDPASDNITVYIDKISNLKELRKTLIHEIQHKIQDTEGFAVGSDTNYWEAKSNKTSGKINVIPYLRRNHAQTARRILENISPELQKKFRSLRLKEKKLGQKDFDALLNKTLSPDERKLYLQWHDIRGMLQKFRELETKDNPFEFVPGAAYSLTAGEIEAFNAEARAYWGEDRRRNTTLEESENVKGGREFQILLDSEGRHYQFNKSNNGNFESQENEIYNQIGTRRKQEMDDALTRHRPDMTEEQRADAINEIEKLGESVRQGGNPKVEKIATKWLLDGHIILPEDNYKILDAIKICEQRYLDPMRFDDPNEILAKYAIKESNAEKRTNPDTIPEFSNKVEYSNDIAVYNVDDTEDGQKAVRNIIDTHWGKDANPWCLAARQNGSLDRAWKFWNNYDSVPKRIAFRNGKLLAFCASDSDTNTWWDREDKSHDGIPYTVKKHGDTFEYSYNEETGKSRKVSEKLTDGTIRYFYENGQLKSEELPDGTERYWYENGNKRSEELPDGTMHYWYENGQLESEELLDGTERYWYENGNKRSEELPDGTMHYWYENGQLESEELPDGTLRSWHESGQLFAEHLPDGTKHQWYENGQLESEELPDGTKHQWYENGNKRSEELPDGTMHYWSEDGMLLNEAIAGSTYIYSDNLIQKDSNEFKRLQETGALHKDSEGNWRQLMRERLSDGTLRAWYENGQLWREILPDGTEHSWYENGQLKSEALPDGTKRQWDKSGNLIYERKTDGTEHFYDKGNRETYNQTAHDNTAIMEHLSDSSNYAQENDSYNKQYSQSARNEGTDENNAVRSVDNFLTPKARQQVDAIRKKYQGTEQWLKAPNGEKTNLNELQWLLVRTPNFKQWFGDWENNKKNSSKIVDRNGEPLVVYHGTTKNKRFKIFKTTPDGAHFGTLNSALDRVATISGYLSYGRLDNHFDSSSAKIIPCFLNIRKLMYTTDAGDDWRPTIHSAKRGGYDGIIYKNMGEDVGSYSFVIFKPNQTKSAIKNNGEFNPDNPEIYKQDANLQNNPFVETYRQYDTFGNSNAESTYRKSLNTEDNPSDGIFRSLRELAKGFKGDFPLLAGVQRFIPAREILRTMNRKSSAKANMTAHSMRQALRGLSREQYNTFSRFMLLNDINSFRKNNPNVELPLGYDGKSFVADYNKFLNKVKNDSTVLNAVNSEINNNLKVRRELTNLAAKLGFSSLAKRLQASDLFLVQYARLIGGQSINSNYIRAIGEMRTTMLQDTEKLSALAKINEKYGKKSELLRKYGKEWRKHIPKGYSLFNPLAGHFIFNAHSLTKNLEGAAFDNLCKELGLPDAAKEKLRGKVEQPFGTQLMVLPDEITDTLQKMSNPIQHGALANFFINLTNAWKKTALYLLPRAAKYNIRNLTGDLDAVIAGNPDALRYLPKSIKELFSVYYGNSDNISPELKRFQAHGGALTFQSAQELGSYKEFKAFNDLIDDMKGKDISAWKNLPRQAWSLVDKFAWSGIQKFSDFREQWLRYATYLSYLEQMQKNGGVPDNWGASVKDEVLAIDNIRDRAFKMANELLGAYDQVSETGKQLRQILVPFYSWIEVNGKRYFQLIKNGLTEDEINSFATRFLKGQMANAPYYTYKAAKTLLYINLFSWLVELFNHLFYPEDEEKLPPDIQGKLHITLGHDDNGNIRYFSQLGAIPDVLEWFNLDTPRYDVMQILNGQLSVSEWLTRLVSAPVNKVVNALSPFIKTPMELITGRSTFPEPLNSRPENNRLKLLAQSLGLSWPYKLLSGEKVDNFEELKRLFIYKQNADEAAYFYAGNLVRKYQEQVLGQKFDGFATSKRSQKLRELRNALRRKDRNTVLRCIHEIAELEGTVQGLKTSIRNMNPVTRLKKSERDKFMKWLSPKDKVYVDRALAYAENFTKLYEEWLKQLPEEDKQRLRDNRIRQNRSR